MHILSSQNVYSRAEGIADHYWPRAFFVRPLVRRSVGIKIQKCSILFLYVIRGTQGNHEIANQKWDKPIRKQIKSVAQSGQACCAKTLTPTCRAMFGKHRNMFPLNGNRSKISFTTKGDSRRLESQSLDDDYDCCQFDVGISSWKAWAV